MHPDPDHDVEPFNPAIIARAPLTSPRSPSLADLARALGLAPAAAPLPGAPLRSYDDFANALAQEEGPR